MDKRAEDGSKGKAKAKGSQRAKAKRSRRGATRKVREQAAGIVDPNLHIVLKDPMRLQIVAIAIQRPISPSEYGKEFDCALSVVSYHFRVLRKHGFLELVDECKVRGSIKHVYRATKSGFISDTDWGEVSQALRPGIAGAILQDFNSRVTQAMEAGTFYKRDDACLFWAPRDLDEIAWPEFISMIAWCIEESERFQVETVNRRAKGESYDSIPATFAIAGFESPTTKQVEAQAKPKRKRKPAQAKGKGKGKGAGKPKKT
jgi:DNA-binding transcriptional ArsR family regulator